MLRQPVRLLLAVALALAFLAAGLPGLGGHAVARNASPVTLEVRLTDLVNGERARAGLPALRVDVRLVDASRRWTARMASTGSLQHDPQAGPSMPPGTQRWAENVAHTGAEDAAPALHDAFMRSSGHRGNLLDRGFTDLGIGIVVDGSGRTWVTQRFTSGAPASIAAAVAATAAATRTTFGGGSATHAVVVRDDAFPDALAAGPLAGPGAPLLLTPPGPVLHPVVRQALEVALPRGRTVYLVGGTAAVSGGVERELADAGWTVRRVSGRDRISTAVAVADEVAARRGRPSTVLLATAADWPDAAAGGAFGARAGAPVLLSHATVLPDATRQALARLRPGSVAALGGTAALSDAVVAEAGAVRSAGASREATAVAIARHLWGRTSASSSPAWTAVPAGGADGWAWAFAAAPLAARRNAPVLLIGGEVSQPVRDYLEGMRYSSETAAALDVYGPLSPRVVDELRAMLQ